MSEIITIDDKEIEINHCEMRGERGCYWDDWEQRGHCECQCPGCNPDPEEAEK